MTVDGIEDDNGDGEDENDDGVDDGDLDDDEPPVLEPFFLGGCGEVAAREKIRCKFLPLHS